MIEKGDSSARSSVGDSWSAIKGSPTTSGSQQRCTHSHKTATLGQQALHIAYTLPSTADQQHPAFVPALLKLVHKGFIVDHHFFAFARDFFGSRRTPGY